VTPPRPPAMSTIGVTKRYPGVLALKDVTLDFLAGEVHALVGQNGAGKSTLIKILSGAVGPSEGQLMIEGQPTNLASPAEATRHGIATITQEMNLVPTLSVAENVLIGQLPFRRGHVDWNATRDTARDLMLELGFDIDPDARVEALSVAQRQGVEIARALSRQAKIVIMDEPTSALAAREIERLLKTIGDLRARGACIIYVSHKFDEVFRISDRMSVFREGSCVATLDAAKTDREAIVRLMVGRILQSSERRRRPIDQSSIPALEVEGLAQRDKFEQISFRLRSKEILGVAGLVGSGRTEILRAIFGADVADLGSVRVAGELIANPRPDRMIDAGVAFVPEDRRTQGLILGMSVVDNISLVELARRWLFGVRDIAGEKSASRQLVDALSIRTASLATPVATLSGGNQQKVAIGKWLRTTPRVLMFDEPTRGVDIAAKSEILRLVESLAEEGMAILLVSSEHGELLQICDRIIVLREGRIVAEFEGRDATDEALTQASFGYTSEMAGRIESRAP
jgi:ABC-type sugar transport system ATPase subunit